MTLARSVCRCTFQTVRHRSAMGRPMLRYQSSQGLDNKEIAELLSTPTWSVESLHSQDGFKDGSTSITTKQLHHLLKLSALPIPASAAEEAEMIDTLKDQLNFVRVVQAVNTTEIQPLTSIRDETQASQREHEITEESIVEHLEKESSVGFARKIVRKPSQVSEADEAERYDPISRATKTIGRYVLVNTKES